MKKIYLLPLLLLISSCTITIENSKEISKDENDNSSNEIITSSDEKSSSISIESSSVEIESSSILSSDEIISSSIEESSQDSSEQSDTPSYGAGGHTANDVTNQEYYKSLVDRAQIHYSEPLINDQTHDISALEIWQINDTHGAYVDGDDITGIAHVKTCINSNTNDPYAAVKIANGDLLQGTAFSNLLLGEPAIAALNEMDFDCFVIGNHEFDWGLDNLAVYKDGNPDNGELNCPFLGANILNKNNERPDFIEPYTVVNKGNVKVGIIGLIGDGLENSISLVSLDGYHFSSTVEAVKKYAKILEEEEKVDVIILSIHDHSETVDQRYVDSCNIDAIINAHDHNYVEDYVTRYDNKRIPVIESNTKNISIGKITLYLDENKKMSSYTMMHYKPSIYEADPNLEHIENVYFAVTSNYENEVIGYKAGGFSKKDLGISTCTYIAEKYDVDVALMNTGGVRTQIYDSEITNGLIFEALPFDNELYMVTLSGQEVINLLGGSSGYYYNKSRGAIGTSITISYFQDDRMYKVIAVDYVATKSYFARYFNEEHGLIKLGDFIRDCALENIRKNYNN